MRQVIYDGSLGTTNSFTYSDAVNLRYIDTFSIEAVSSGYTTSAVTFVDADVNVGTDTITILSHGLTLGQAFQLTTTGVIPGGLNSSGLVYYAIVVDSDNIQLATTYANALSSTAVDITSAAGGGTHTLTPRIYSVLYRLLTSNDGTNWAVSSEQFSLTTSAPTKISNVSGAGYQWARARFQVSGGVNSTIVVTFAGKESVA